MNTTLPAFFNQCVARFSGNIFLWENKGAGYEGMTYSAVQQRVNSLTAGLIHAGIKRGDRLALLSESRNDWVVSELGILCAGAVNVPLSVRMNEPEEIRFRIVHSGACMVIVSANQLPKVRDIRSSLPDVVKIIVLDQVDDLKDDELYIENLIADGETLLARQSLMVSERMAGIQPDDPANISYTSGTTSDPKGIILTHRNFVVNVHQAYSLMDISEDFVTLLILPWDHAFAHTAGIYCFMGKGASIASVQIGKTMMETLKNLPKNIREIGPHLLFTVPAIAKNFRKNIEKGISDKGAFTMNLFSIGLRITELYNGSGFDRGRSWKIFLKPMIFLFDRMIFAKVRAGFGGRLQFFIGGGALLDIELQRFFYAIGIPMLQGYGLTEASPLISANALHSHKLGSSGMIVKDMELKICDENGTTMAQGAKGEIVIRGGNVMAGYWKNPEATLESLKNGWLHTGDMGYVDPDGFLYVLGRFKSLLIADDGEKYSPEGMEEIMMTQSPFIDQCMLYNNQNPYTVILVHPNRERLLGYLRDKKVAPESDAGVGLALEKIAQELSEYRTGGKYGELFPQRWLPAAIGVLSEGFTEENHLLNFQLKTVRGKVVERYAGLIARLYTPAGKNVLHPENRESMKQLLSGHR
jgi:long-chain acyl-CoA synthetase